MVDMSSTMKDEKHETHKFYLTALQSLLINTQEYNNISSIPCRSPNLLMNILECPSNHKHTMEQAIAHIILFHRARGFKLKPNFLK